TSAKRLNGQGRRARAKQTHSMIAAIGDLDYARNIHWRQPHYGVGIVAREHNSAISPQSRAVVSRGRNRNDVAQAGETRSLAVTIVAPADNRSIGAQRETVIAARRHSNDIAGAAGNNPQAGGRVTPSDHSTVFTQSQAV